MHRTVQLRPWSLAPLGLCAVLIGACGGSAASDDAPTSSTISATTSSAALTTVPTGQETTTIEPQTTTTANPTTTTEPAAAAEIQVLGGEVVGGPRSIEVELGSMVHLIVLSDGADHVHVHGYDLFFDVDADMPAEIMFTADVPGLFEIEMEGSHLLVAELQVS